MGTYLVDINAMFFGMPNALFPALAGGLGGAGVLGLLYSAPAVGAIVASASARGYRSPSLRWPSPAAATGSAAC